ncbi:MAG TPA: T9SS type A sorting domain-containing protein [Flavobacteriaceae bacterium]|nr:T9SS type A sorting domain-containing protein [Flavobacteriaceae bacterium]
MVCGDDVDYFYDNYNVLPDFDADVNTNCIFKSESFNFGKEINLFPNPTTGILNISKERGIQKVEVFSLTGEQLIQQKGNLKTIDLGALQHGIYFVELTGENGTKLIKKIIKN